MLFTPGPTQQQAEWSRTPGQSLAEAMDELQPTADVWPDNERAVNVFVRAMTQWRVGFNGPYALDYNCFPIVAPKEFASPEWPEIFEEIKVLEVAALETMAEQKPKGVSRSG